MNKYISKIDDVLDIINLIFRGVLWVLVIFNVYNEQYDVAAIYTLIIIAVAAADISRSIRLKS